MELLGKQTYVVHQQRISAALLGRVSCNPSYCGIIRSQVLPALWTSTSKLPLLPRTSSGVVSTTSGGKCRTDCRVWKWIFQYQEQRLVRPQVESTATISAGRRSITSARRRSRSPRPEGSGGFNADLELEILAFMLQSGKSDAFPSKEELICAGRLDLVEAIVAEGGWLASGWERKASDSVLSGVIQEVSYRPLTRQRAPRNNSKAVRSPRRPRGRPKLAGRRSSSISASPCENSEPDEPQKGAITGQTDDQKVDSPCEGNGTDGNGDAKLERFEKDRAASSLFEQVRKQAGSKFPSSSAGYRLWEFESLSAFIEYRKLDARNVSMQRQQMGLCSNSSVRKRRLDPEAAKRRRKLCDRRCDADSEPRRIGCKREKGTSVKKELDTASTLEQDTKVDDPISVKIDFDSGLTIQQHTMVDEAVNPQAELENATTIVKDTGVDGAVNPQPELETATTIEQDTGVDEAVIFEAEVDTATTIEQDRRVSEALNPEPELNTPPTIEQGTRFDDGIYPQAELDSARTDEISDSNYGKHLEDTQTSSTAPKVDLPLAAEQDPGAEEGSGSYGHLQEASTGQQEGREPSVESEGKLKKRKKKRKKVKREKIEDTCKAPEKLSEALDWINQMVEQREKWMLEGKSSLEEGPSYIPKALQGRIRSLEDSLSADRTALQSGREALGRKGGGEEQPTSKSDVHTRRLAELRDASDELEFTENKILKLSSELTTTRREVAALEGARRSEITDARYTAGENEEKIEKASVQSLRAARIVWPHPAQEVLLIGSFDGWNQKIKMELSGAGVHVVSFPLPPGRYEIKFIVDGTWRVDTGRPIVYVGGYENNVLDIPEQFTFDWRK